MDSHLGKKRSTFLVEDTAFNWYNNKFPKILQDCCFSFRLFCGEPFMICPRMFTYDLNKYFWDPILITSSAHIIVGTFY